MLTKEQRAEWLGRKLDSLNISEYGRAAGLAKIVGCSNAVCQGWLGGSLPKDFALGLKLCNELGLSAWEWVSGETSKEQIIKRSDAVEAARWAREIEQNMKLSEDQFMGFVEVHLGHGPQAEKPIQDVLDILER